MKVKVVGTKYQMGTSKKSGKPYDVVIIAYTRKADQLGYNGESAGELWCDRKFFEALGRDPVPGDTLLVDRNGSFVEDVAYEF